MYFDDAILPSVTQDLFWVWRLPILPVWLKHLFFWYKWGPCLDKEHSHRFSVYMESQSIPSEKRPPRTIRFKSLPYTGPPKIQTIFLRALSKCSLNSGSLGPCPLPTGEEPTPDTQIELWWQGAFGCQTAVVVDTALWGEEDVGMWVAEKEAGKLNGLWPFLKWSPMCRREEVSSTE